MILRTDKAQGSVVDGMSDAQALIEKYNSENSNAIVNVAKDKVVVLIESDGTDCQATIYVNETPAAIGVDIIQNDALVTANQVNA